MPQNVHAKLKTATRAVAFSKLHLCLTCAGLTFRWSLFPPVSEASAADPTGATNTWRISSVAGRKQVMAAVRLAASAPIHQSLSASGGTPLKVTSLCGGGGRSLIWSPICSEWQRSSTGETELLTCACWAGLV